ncbi:Sm domain-containing protein [Trichostrongylus colubriformis]|uniref:Sm domain-containing protein n=1 Tax=Trichostrongylus colubriformis TaxID=6319 RepID=A0AAN8IWP1_TRICO
MSDPFSVNFNATLELERFPDGSVDNDFHGSLDDFEKALVAEEPEVVQLICDLDKPPATKSKKQQKRERIGRLEDMTIGGRKLFEPRAQPSVRQDVLNAMHNQWSTGPSSLLHRAMKHSHRVEVDRVDRIARGYVVAFDRHMNVVMRDVDEVALPGRKEERLFGRRKIHEGHLPPGMQWQPGGDWSRPLGECRTVPQRHLPVSMIKGDTIVMFRLLQ